MSPGSDPMSRLLESLAMQATIWGYPLLESIRTCRLTTAPGDSRAQPVRASGGFGPWHPPINAFSFSDAPADDTARDVVTPANDLLYATAWLNLADGPVLLHVPAPDDRYFVMALYDAWTENFRNLGPRDLGGAPAGFALVGPRWRGTLPDGVREVRAPTDLVWIIGRILVVDAEDLPAARALQERFALESMSPAPVARPASVERWRDAAAHEPEGPVFFENLARALADQPPPADQAALASWYSILGLVPGAPFDATRLPPQTAAALQRGWQAAMDLIRSATRSRRANAWSLSFRLGRWGHDWLPRAITAMKGLGALAADEALYAMSDFDAERRPLHGANDYALRFAAGELPPCDAFWSITMYGEDFFLVPNPIHRFAIGDRTRGLRREADGSLTVRIGHGRPADTSNWLPAPDGPFYLILRMYHPRPEARGWRIPPATCLQRRQTIAERT